MVSAVVCNSINGVSLVVTVNNMGTGIVVEGNAVFVLDTKDMLYCLILTRVVVNSCKVDTE